MPKQDRPFPSFPLFRPVRGATGLTILTLLALAPLQSALAQQTAAGAQWGLGLGASYERKAYRDFDDKVRALPLILYENSHVSLFGPTFDVKLPSAGPVALRLRARYAGDGYEADDSPFLAGMAERKGGFWLGGAAAWRTAYANLSAELLGDASGHSKGAKFKLMLDRSFRQGMVDITPRIAANWADSKFVDYYYGVKDDEARAGRAAYHGDASVNLELGLRVGYALAPRQSVFVDVSATSLGSEIKDSPLVGRASQTGVRFGYLYRFQ